MSDNDTRDLHLAMVEIKTNLLHITKELDDIKQHSNEFIQKHTNFTDKCHLKNIEFSTIVTKLSNDISKNEDSIVRMEHYNDENYNEIKRNLNDRTMEIKSDINNKMNIVQIRMDSVNSEICEIKNMLKDHEKYFHYAKVFRYIVSTMGAIAIFAIGVLTFFYK